MQPHHLADSPQKGRINVGWSKYAAWLDAAETPRERAFLLGHSPGMAAQLAGVSRQAIHYAIDDGRLTAIYIHDDKSGEVKAILIPDAALQKYAPRKYLEKR